MSNSAALQQLLGRRACEAQQRHPKRLLRYGFKVYSQSDEDGIIQEIFNRIGTSNRVFIEAGVECNSVKLLIEGGRLARRRRAARRHHPRQFPNVHR